MTGHEQFTEDLALYALGELEEARSRQFAEHLEVCPACRRELEQLMSDAALLSLSTAGAAPPAHAKQRLMKAIANEPRITQMVQQKPRWWSLAPVFATAVLAIFAILLWVDNNELRGHVYSMQAQMQQSSVQLAQSKLMLDALDSPQTQRVTLVALNQKPQPQAHVFYMKKQHAVMLVADFLVPLPEHKVYELWIIPSAAGGSPIPSGTFAPDARGHAIAMVPNAPANVDAKAFAVTIENEGGSEKPTMPIVMMGS